jgi:hypothetical protein
VEIIKQFLAKTYSSFGTTEFENSKNPGSEDLLLNPSRNAVKF